MFGRTHCILSAEWVRPSLGYHWGTANGRSIGSIQRVGLARTGLGSKNHTWRLLEDVALLAKPFTLSLQRQTNWCWHHYSTMCMQLELSSWQTLEQTFSLGKWNRSTCQEHVTFASWASREIYSFFQQILEHALREHCLERVICSYYYQIKYLHQHYDYKKISWKGNSKNIRPLRQIIFEDRSKKKRDRSLHAL